MSRFKRRVLAAAVALGGAVALSVVGGGTAQAAPTVQIGEVAWCAYPLNWSACAAANDAQPWALGMAEWLYPGTLDAGRGDAFRHCLWSGAIAQRVGYDKSWEVTWVHEMVDPEPVESSRLMDLQNNMIGSAIGARSNEAGVSDTWGWIISECRGRADAGLLAGPNGVTGI